LLFLGRAITQIINLVGRTHKLSELAAAIRSERNKKISSLQDGQQSGCLNPNMCPVWWRVNLSVPGLL